MNKTREKEAAEYPHIDAAFIENLCDTAEVFFANGEWEKTRNRIDDSLIGLSMCFSPREWARRMPLTTRLRIEKMYYEFSRPSAVEILKIKLAKKIETLETAKLDGTAEWLIKVYTNQIEIEKCHLQGAIEHNSEPRKSKDYAKAIEDAHEFVARFK